MHHSWSSTVQNTGTSSLPAQLTPSIYDHPQITSIRLGFCTKQFRTWKKHWPSPTTTFKEMNWFVQWDLDSWRNVQYSQDQLYGVQKQNVHKSMIKRSYLLYKCVVKRVIWEHQRNFSELTVDTVDFTHIVERCCHWNRNTQVTASLYNVGTAIPSQHSLVLGSWLSSLILCNTQCETSVWCSYFRTLGTYWK